MFNKLYDLDNFAIRLIVPSLVCGLMLIWFNLMESDVSYLLAVASGAVANGIYTHFKNTYPEFNKTVISKVYYTVVTAVSCMALFVVAL